MRATPGGRANGNGRTAETLIGAVLKGKGMPFVPQYPIGNGIYGTPIKVDFYLPTAPGYLDGLIIEAKWQDANGSVEEKLPYLWFNIEHHYPCPAIVVIDGPGFRPGAVEWLRGRARVNSNLADVFNLQEFVSWCNRNL